MKPTKKIIKTSFIAITFLLCAMISLQTFARKKPDTLRIGIYDSRVVTFAWSRSDYFTQHIKKFSQQSDSAKKANDSARMKELGIEAMSYQHLLHQMIFSNGSVTIIMASVKDKLPELAKTAGVSIILSKWELNYSDPSLEVVDLTNQVAQLFQPKENIDKMAADIAAQAPVPIDELGIEAEMLDYYVKLFGKK